MEKNPGLIVKRFQYCGSFPLANEVADGEFEKSRIYFSNAPEDAAKILSEESGVLQIIAQSPKKKRTTPIIADLMSLAYQPNAQKIQTFLRLLKLPRNKKINSYEDILLCSKKSRKSKR